MARICMLVRKPCTNDARVLREAASLTAAGHSVTVIASKTLGVPNIEYCNGFLIRRVTRSIERRQYDESTRSFAGQAFDALRSLAQRPSRPHDASPENSGAQGRHHFTLKALACTLLSVPVFLYRETLNIYDTLVSASAAFRAGADIYHAHDFNTLWAGFIAARLRHVPLIYDSHELYTETTFLTDAARRFYRVQERFLARFIDHCITVNESIAAELVKRYQMPTPTVIYNCAPKPQSDDDKNARKAVQSMRKLGRSPVIIYLGGFSAGRGIVNLIRSASFLKKGRIVLMGYGKLQGELQTLVEREGLSKRVKFLPPVPQEHVVSVAHAAKIGVIPYQAVSLNNYYSTPNKLFEYIAAGLPVVASAFPELKKVVEKHSIGETFDPDSPQSIATAINRLLSDKEYYDECKRHSVQIAEMYCWENEARKLLRVYESLTGR